MLTHSIAPNISFHDQPCQRTTKKHENSRRVEVFQFTPRKFVIQTWLCNCPQYLCLFHIVVECSPSIHDPRKDVGSPKSTSLLSTFHIGSMLCFFPAKLMSSTYTDKNNPFYVVRRCIPNWKPFPNRAAIGFSQIAFPTIVLPKDDRTNSFQEEQLGLRDWTMI